LVQNVISYSKRIVSIKWFDNRVLRRIFGLKKQEVRGRQKMLQRGASLFRFSADVVRVMKSSCMDGRVM
jgi:hypothetical protein